MLNKTMAHFKYSQLTAELYAFADHECIKEELGEILISITAMRLSNIQGWEAAEGLVMTGYPNIFKSRVKYLTIEEEKRVALEKIKALELPFNPIEAMNALIQP